MLGLGKELWWPVGTCGSSRDVVGMLVLALGR